MITEETRSKMSAAHMGKKHPMRGHIVTSEARANMSLAFKRRTIPPEQRVKISKSLKGRTLSPETRAKIAAANIGKHPSKEIRLQMSAADMGRVVSPEARAKISKALWKGGSQVYCRKSHSKRRALGFVQLNSSFVGSEAHHVDNEQVINMPKALHHSVYHRQSDGRGMAKINAIAYNFLFKQEVEAAMPKAQP